MASLPGAVASQLVLEEKEEMEDKQENGQGIGLPFAMIPWRRVETQARLCWVEEEVNIAPFEKTNQVNHSVLFEPIQDKSNFLTL